MEQQFCVLVDDNDNVIGTEEKLLTHRKGLLHRAFSAFVFNDKNEVLLQRRAMSKYHSPGLWTNTCCSHPQPGEAVISAGERRLTEELNFTVPLKPAFKFIYRAELGNGLTEYEFDHVLIGRYNEIPNANEDEVSECRFVSLEQLKEEIDLNPENFTIWLRIIVHDHLDLLKSKL